MKENADKLDLYSTVIVDLGFYSTKNHLKFKTKTLFSGVDLSGKNVLDIGGGNGIFSFYAASKGAETVTCVEPEQDGSSAKMIDEFNMIKSRINCTNVSLEKKTLQQFKTNGTLYDVILMHNSINHIDEDACIQLLNSREARQKYTEIFRKIFNLTAAGGIVLISDCSSKNFFAAIHMKNIFAPNIEWNKHQSPEVWSSLMKQAGFSNPKISWNSPKQLGRSGKLLLGHKLTSYFIGSHFRLKMVKI